MIVIGKEYDTKFGKAHIERTLLKISGVSYEPYITKGYAVVFEKKEKDLFESLSDARKQLNNFILR